MQLFAYDHDTELHKEQHEVVTEVSCLFDLAFCPAEQVRAFIVKNNFQAILHKPVVDLPTLA